ncbi:RNA polymerase sigma factor [Gordonia rubripertincta]|uniref:RNA polymerase sigma factor n=1 Tax=Gordonia rubripertincta TaxID=36822 RepID=A0ABT4MU40_GORRU|nr:RNA polymerase sigma factor [Gordonia rubripertincta]MCZ4549247.1 RNA polymerase sigma factor [Gordonia rubripertincta]
MSGPEAISRTVDAVWRIEAAKIIATLTRMVGDVGLAEDLAQEALVEAMSKWPESGVPRNPGAWLTTVAKRRAVDGWRRQERLEQKYVAIARDLETRPDADLGWDPDHIDDDVLRLVFVSAHPVLAREGQIALTLRVVGGLTTDEIAQAFLTSTATIQQRIVRAKKTLKAADVPFEVPPREEYPQRLSAVLTVLYLIFNEGYSASSGDRWIRSELCTEALRLGKILTGLVPDEPEVHALVALMEFQASRFGARTTKDGTPILLSDQDRSRWDQAQIRRGVQALARADDCGRGRGPYGLQAALAQCHATAPTAQDTDWQRIVILYEALGRIAPSPVVDLNRAVAVSMASGPEPALGIVDELVATGALSRSHLLPAVRGELLARLHRDTEAHAEFLVAAEMAGNQRESAVLRAKAAALGDTFGENR